MEEEVMAMVMEGTGVWGTGVGIMVGEDGEEIEDGEDGEEEEDGEEIEDGVGEDGEEDMVDLVIMEGEDIIIERTL
jgi:hypothetical protein